MGWFVLTCTGILWSLSGKGQICTGSLGDPVVWIDFGTGTGTHFGLVPQASYTYTPSSCPNDGFYSITNNSAGCFSGSWHSVSADHTGNGNFMLVNASYQPGDFIHTTVTGLCPNTTYEFAAWVMNVLNNASGIQPNITFSIETLTGTLLNQFQTGDIPATSSPQWRQYGFFFTTSASVSSVVLRMTNNAPGGIGNDLALDDITFRPCGPLLTAGIQGQPERVEVCVYNQQPYQFTAGISPGFTLPHFQWQVSTDTGATWQDIPGANSQNYTRTLTTAGEYHYRLTALENGNQGISSCRIASNVLVIYVAPRPVIHAGPDRVILSGNNAVLEATAADSSQQFVWTPPDFLDNTASLRPVASPDRDITYTLTATTDYGCIASDQVMVRVIAGIFVPTAFTPNRDGKNDSWRIPFLDPLWGATVSVYNRYGQLVYRVAGAAVNWDGTLGGLPQPSGVYVYHIQFTDGSAPLKGVLSIIR